MYIVAIAWGYVVLMMAITEESIIAGVMTLALYGILPMTLILYIMGTGQRKRNRARAAAASASSKPVPDAGTASDPFREAQDEPLEAARDPSSTGTPSDKNG